MFTKLPTEKPPNPEQILTGQCCTCRHKFEIKRANTSFSGEWKDVPCCECPNPVPCIRCELNPSKECARCGGSGKVVCGARVYVKSEDRALGGQLDAALMEVERVHEEMRRERAVHRMKVEGLEAEVGRLKKELAEAVSKDMGQAALMAKLLGAAEREEDVKLTERDELLIRIMELEELPPLPEGLGEEEEA